MLLSGGLDSATALAIARAQGFACHTLAVDYGQRHAAELAGCARSCRGTLGAVEHRQMDVDLAGIGGSALTDPRHRGAGGAARSGIPVTYVPARNTLLLSLALGWAEVLGAHDIFIGVNAVDYSGYPDCRPEFIAAFETLARLATRAGVEGGRFAHPGAADQQLSKAEIIRSGVAARRGLRADGVLLPGRRRGVEACGRCDSCRLRREGFAAAGVAGPHALRLR